MKLTLTPWERISLVNVLYSLSGRASLGTLRKASLALDVLELSEEEQEEIGLEVYVLEDGSRMTWDDAHDEDTWDVEIGDREAVNLLKRTFEQYEGWHVRERERVEVLAEKLGL